MPPGLNRFLLLYRLTLLSLVEIVFTVSTIWAYVTVIRGNDSLKESYINAYLALLCMGVIASFCALVFFAGQFKHTIVVPGSDRDVAVEGLLKRDGYNAVQKMQILSNIIVEPPNDGDDSGDSSIAGEVHFRVLENLQFTAAQSRSNDRYASMYVALVMLARGIAETKRVKRRSVCAIAQFLVEYIPFIIMYAFLLNAFEDIADVQAKPFWVSMLLCIFSGGIKFRQSLDYPKHASSLMSYENAVSDLKDDALYLVSSTVRARTAEEGGSDAYSGESPSVVGASAEPKHENRDEEVRGESSGESSSAAGEPAEPLKDKTEEEEDNTVSTWEDENEAAHLSSVDIELCFPEHENEKNHGSVLSEHIGSSSSLDEREEPRAEVPPPAAHLHSAMSVSALKNSVVDEVNSLPPKRVRFSPPRTRRRRLVSDDSMGSAMSLSDFYCPKKGESATLCRDVKEEEKAPSAAASSDQTSPSSSLSPPAAAVKTHGNLSFI